MKKSTFRTMAEAIAFGGLKKVELPTENVNYRRMTVDEIKQCIVEEFKDAKSVKDIELKEPAKGWGDTALEKEIEWVKTLNIKEFFNRK